MLGDSNTGNDVFDSVGFTRRAAFLVRQHVPGQPAGYAPTVRGIARTPAKVVVRQNGYVIYQSYVQPGAFAITDLNTYLFKRRSGSDRRREGRQVSNAIPCRTPPCRCCSVKVAGSMTSWPGITEAVTAIRTRRSSPRHADYRSGQWLHALRRYAAGVALYRGGHWRREKLGDWGRCRSISPMPAASWRTTAAMKASPCVSCMQNHSTDSAPTSSCWAIATPRKGFTPRMMWRRSMEGYQYADSKDDDGVPDVQSYHNLTWNKKGASSSTSLSRWVITAQSMSPAASRPTGAPASRTSGISSAMPEV